MMKYGIIDLINMDIVSDTYFNLLQIVHRKDHPQQRWGPRMRYYYSIHYIRNGETVFIIDDKTYHLKKGDSIIFYPDQVVYFYTVQETSCDVYWISFNGILADNIIACTSFSKKNPVIHSEEDLSYFYEDILKNKGEDPSAHMKIMGYMYILFAEYTRITQDNKNAAQANSGTYFQKASEYITKHLSEEIDIDELCRTVNISKSHLYRVFNGETGMPINQYINKLRIEKSLNLLRLTNMTIQEISSQMGFKNQLYFSRVFSDYIGVPPSQYRKMKLFMAGPRDPSDSEKLFAQKIKEYIEQNYKETITSDLLSEVFQCEKKKLMKKFKFAFQISIQDYLLSVRMANAAEMLKNGFSISDTARQCGYQEISYFSRIFKKCYGLNPQNYKRLNIRKKDDGNRRIKKT